MPVRNITAKRRFHVEVEIVKVLQANIQPVKGDLSFSRVASIRLKDYDAWSTRHNSQQYGDIIIRMLSSEQNEVLY